MNNLLNKYLNKIDEISSKEMNQDQKDLAKEILKSADPKNLQNIYQFVVQRIKIGFRFDAAPEVIHDQISLLEKDEKLSFVLDENKSNQNHLIIGENYDALKNLLVIELERASQSNNSDAYYDVIYIDPPYNTEASATDGNIVANDKEELTNNKFIYRDKFSRNGWLNMMNERLRLARQLLKEDGVIFVSIDDSEQAYLKILMDEIFGEENFVTNIVWVSNKKGRQISKKPVSETLEYILMYKKDINYTNNFLLDWDFGVNLMPSIYSKKDLEIKKDEKGDYIIQNELHNTSINNFNKNNRPNLFFPIYTNGIEVSIYKKENFVEVWPPKNKEGLQGVWRWSKEKIIKDYKDLEVIKSNNNYKIYTKVRNFSYKFRNVILSEKITTRSGNNLLQSIINSSQFNTAKPSSLLKLLLVLLNNKNSKILDFFAGSGTTGHAVLELNKEDGGNRTFTLVTNNQNNIGINVNYERLFRINHGVGTKNENFTWANKNEPYKSNLQVFNIKYKNIDPFQNINNEVIDQLNKTLKDFDVKSNKEFNNEDILRSLSSLKTNSKE